MNGRYRNDRDHIDAMEAQLNLELTADQIDDLLDATCTMDEVALFTAVGIVWYDPSTDTLSTAQGVES